MSNSLFLEDELQNHLVGKLRSYHYSAIIPLCEQLRVGQEGGSSVHQVRVCAHRILMSR